MLRLSASTSLTPCPGTRPAAPCASSIRESFIPITTGTRITLPRLERLQTTGWNQSGHRSALPKMVLATKAPTRTTRNPMNRIIMLIVVAILAVATCSAQDWAKARLEKSPRHLEWVKVKHGNREVNCFIAYPEVKDKATAVIVIHEIFGLSDWVRGVTDQLAEAGYIAIAPDFLTGTPGERGNDAARGAIGQLRPDQITGDLNAA